jgi:hypothetical protein
MNWKGCGTNKPKPNLRFICLQRLRKTTTMSVTTAGCSDRVSNRVPLPNRFKSVTVSVNLLRESTYRCNIFMYFLSSRIFATDCNPVSVKNSTEQKCTRGSLQSVLHVISREERKWCVGGAQVCLPNELERTFIPLHFHIRHCTWNAQKRGVTTRGLVTHVFQVRFYTPRCCLGSFISVTGFLH